MRNAGPNPNLFTGDIDERKVTERMAKIVERDTFTPKGRLDDFQVSVTRMSEFHDDAYSVEREEVEDTIRRVMVGQRLRQCFENASQLISVRHRLRQNELLGVALCSVGTFYDLESITAGDNKSLYTWYISAFGTHLDEFGRMNEYVLRQIARQATESALGVAETLHSIHGTYGSDAFSSGIYIDAAHTADPTVISDGIHLRIEQMMEALRVISMHPATQGTGFPDTIAEMDRVVATLKAEHGSNPLVQSFSESRPIAQTLSYQSVSMGGDPSTYRKMRRVASATLSFFTSLLRALDAEFLRLTARNLATNPVIESSEDQSGGISIMADQQRGFPQASLYLTPSDETTEPIIRFGENYNQQEYTPALMGELWKKVVVGKWWQSEVAAP